jgi:hypothetical protein
MIPMSASSPNTGAIDYAPPTPAWRRRSLRRRIVLTTVLLGLAAATCLLGPAAWHRVTLWSLQRACLNASALPDHVVFDDDPVRAAPLVAGDSQYTQTDPDAPTSWFSRDWERFYARLSPPGKQRNTTVYLGELSDPAGNRRLVAIESIRWHGPRGSHPFAASHTFHATVIEPGTILTPPRELLGTAAWSKLLVEIPSGMSFRMFAGRQDPKDPSHFEIPYELGTTRGMIDGWLGIDAGIKMETRDGSLKRQTAPLPPAAALTPPPPSSAASPRTPG